MLSSFIVIYSSKSTRRFSNHAWILHHDQKKHDDRRITTSRFFNYQMALEAEKDLAGKAEALPRLAILSGSQFGSSNHLAVAAARSWFHADAIRFSPVYNFYPWYSETCLTGYPRS